MLATVLAAALSTFAPGSAPDTMAIVPRLQSLDLEIDPGQARWSGSLQAWLTVRRPVRTLSLALAGPVVSRVEINVAGGPADLIHGERPRGTLTIETRAPLPAGRAAMNVAFEGAFADTAPGLVRTPPRSVALTRGDGAAFPAWRAGTPVSRWRLVIHVPAGCRVSSAIPLQGISRQGAWRTWTFESRRAMRAADVAFEVRPPPRRTK